MKLLFVNWAATVAVTVASLLSLADAGPSRRHLHWSRQWSAAQLRATHRGWQKEANQSQFGCVAAPPDGLTPPEPAPEPAPEPQPEPAPEPQPEPRPVPEPEPAPAGYPRPSPAPAPEPLPQNATVQTQNATVQTPWQTNWYQEMIFGAPHGMAFLEQFFRCFEIVRGTEAGYVTIDRARLQAVRVVYYQPHTDPAYDGPTDVLIKAYGRHIKDRSLGTCMYLGCHPGIFASTKYQENIIHKTPTWAYSNAQWRCMGMTTWESAPPREQSDLMPKCDPKKAAPNMVCGSQVGRSIHADTVPASEQCGAATPQPDEFVVPPPVPR